MTSVTNARVAGVTFLLYIVAGIASMALARNTQVTSILTLVTSICALVLGVTLYALTRGEDADLALLALTCRVIEAIPGKDGAFFFALGSTIFCWLLLRGRMIPSALAWLGVISSAFLVILLPLQRSGLWHGGAWSSKLTWLQWMPMLVFELVFAFWLIFKGVRLSRSAASTSASRA
jgi:hypothetical protein